MDILLASTQSLFRRPRVEPLATSLQRELRQAGHRCDQVRLPWAGDRQGHEDDLRALQLLYVPGRNRREQRVLALDLPAWIWAHGGRRTLWLAEECPSLEEPARQAWRRALEGTRGYAISATAAQRAKRLYGVDLVPLYPAPARPVLGELPEEADLVSLWRPQERLELVLGTLEALPHRHLCVAEIPLDQQRVWREAALAAGLGDRLRLREGSIESFAPGCRCLLITASFSVDPSAALAALAAGCPTVATDDAGAPLEWIFEGANGRVVAPRPDALALALEELAQVRVKEHCEAEARRLAETLGAWPAIWSTLTEEVL